MKDVDTGTYSSLIYKGNNQFYGIRVQGNRAVLQGPDSGAKLHVPSGLDGFISGHMHLDANPFLQFIPESECLVSPIVEYIWSPSEGKESVPWFKIKIPHCVTKYDDLKTIKVRHGDIHKSLPFVELPTITCHFDVDTNHIIIYTQHFSQFICTSCRKLCQAEAKAFIFGSISPFQYKPIRSTLKLYLCSPLYNLLDYKMVSNMDDNTTCFIQHSNR